LVAFVADHFIRMGILQCVGIVLPIQLRLRARGPRMERAHQMVAGVSGVLAAIYVVAESTSWFLLPCSSSSFEVPSLSYGDSCFCLGLQDCMGTSHLVGMRASGSVAELLMNFQPLRRMQIDSLL